jgi:cytochrome c oxidase cbb3-type subunit 1
MSAHSTMSVPDSREESTGTLPVSERLPSQEIDASLRWPLLALFTSSAVWLLVGLGLGLLGAIKMHKGDFLADYSWLTVGRIRPASMNAILYGFASQAAMGVLYWLLCRLGNVRFAYHFAVMAGTKLWNIGVLVGVLGILMGASSGFEWLEMPRYASVLLFVAYALMGLCAVGTFQMRRERSLYPTQWFLFAALFWFPWLYTAGNYLLVIDPVRGTLQSVISAWYAGGFLHLWLGLIALGIIYYFLPKLGGQPLHSSYLASAAFWTTLFFGSWAGMASLQGAPVPRWVPAVGVAATLCLIFAVVCNAMNWTRTLCPTQLFKKSAEARFISFGLACYLLAGVVDLALAFPKVQRVLGLTLAGSGAKALFIHGFVGSTLFGAIYYILPRLVQVNWASDRLIRFHFWLHAAGAILIFAGLLVGGVVQGTKLANPATAFLTIAKGSAPFVGLSTLGILLLLLGQVMMVINLSRLMRAYLEPLAREYCAEVCGCLPSRKAGVKS